MTQPSVVAIFVTEVPAKPMQQVKSAEAIAGQGLGGDRTGGDPSKPRRGEPEQEITLIESEAIEAVHRDYDLALEPSETRRNLLTRGVALNHLVGREFSVGPVRLRGLELCEPCTHLESLTRKGLMRALLHRGGLRAQIVQGGTISTGDIINTES